ncbi:AlbA family DNA-binding domain-containing protein [Mycobacterium malmoense]|uniref:AlbA family DNA-binding domain-containing protein n=1 Tax=Mycobacterium malmoense TaxID=1780 RepID=UPI0011475610|nr:ATP-binding protein [Mycobacterium malmoense]
MNILYVAYSPQIGGGVNLQGRSLVRHLYAEHDLRVCSAIVGTDSPVFRDEVPDSAMSADALDEFDVVYMEGGWNDDSADEFSRGVRFPLALAEAFVRRGGQLIVADVGRGVEDDQHHSLVEAVHLFDAEVRYDDQRGVRYLRDEYAETGSGTRFFTDQMDVSDWLHPALDGIDSILADQAVDLQAGWAIAASGNSTTDVWLEGAWLKRSLITPWASVNQYGRGHAVLICAAVSDDRLVDSCPDNARWISNLIALLADRSQETAGWLINKSARPEGGSGIRGLLDHPESQRLERKSSFLVPADPQRPDIPHHVIQHGVGKSIAAFANTDGGHVIIGQDDQGTFLGLENDFATVRNKDRDGFEQRLVQYADNHLNPRWETLGLKVHWIETEAGDVAVVEVPESYEIVWLKQKGGPEEVYVRRGTRTDALSGPDLANWLKARQRR